MKYTVKRVLALIIALLLAVPAAYAEPLAMEGTGTPVESDIVADDVDLSVGEAGLDHIFPLEK